VSNRYFTSTIPLYCGLFILSAAVLALELVSMRVLSFMLWHHLAYMVLSVALLGFGASGAWLASSRYNGDARTLTVRSAILFAVSNLLGVMVLARIQLDTFEFGPEKIVKLGFYYVVLIIPYFFAGLAVAVIFREIGRKTTAFYCVNLLGSGFGCQLFLYGIAPLGGPKALAGISLLGAVAALLWSRGGPRRLVTQSAFSLLVISGLLPLADRLMSIQPAASKALAVQMKYPGARIAFSEWTPLARIDVSYADWAFHPFMGAWIPGNRMRTITIDGDATTWIFRNKDLLKSLSQVSDDKRRELLKLNAYATPFLIKHNPEVLILGVGGGNEVAVALAAGAKHVTGVDINPAILAQSTRYLRDFYGNLYDRRRATAVVAEGRSFVRASDKRFDIIQMSGVDTWSGLSSGAYVLSENYLYTVEATRDFLDHLTPDGVLSIGRYLFNPPRESLRLVANCLRALKEMGVAHPQRHIMVASAGIIGGARVLVKRSPFTRAEANFYYDLLNKDIPNGVFWYGPYVTEKLRPNPFLSLVRTVASGPKSEQSFYDRYLYDVTPVYDNKPFFFEYYKWKNLLRDMAYGGKGGQVGANKPIGLMVLLALLIQVVLLSLVFIFVPLYRLRNRGQRLPFSGLMVGGFGSLGLAFMLVEIGLMQKFVLFLGHPTYSISITLSAMLIGSGLGSLVSGYLPMSVEKRLFWSVASIVAITFIYLFFLDRTFNLLLGYSMAFRQAAAFALIGTLAFPMGMPFPLTLSCCNELGAHTVPWALSINGAASVLGGVLCIFIAMSAGFSAVLIVAASLYAVALPCLVGLRAKVAERTAIAVSPTRIATDRGDSFVEGDLVPARQSPVGAHPELASVHIQPRSSFR
jgi:spermidine synthase